MKKIEKAIKENKKMCEEASKVIASMKKISSMHRVIDYVKMSNKKCLTNALSRDLIIGKEKFRFCHTEEEDAVLLGCKNVRYLYLNSDDDKFVYIDMSDGFIHDKFYTNIFVDTNDSNVKELLSHLTESDSGLGREEAEIFKSFIARNKENKE